MRKTRLELLADVPCWNEQKHDIVKVSYGDEPLIHWDNEKHECFAKLVGTLSNINAVDAYIHAVNGDYYIYDTLIGKSYIKEDGTVLCGNVNVAYRGKRYSIYLNKMYGLNGLTITRIDADGMIVGFSNIDGQGSSTSRNHTKEADSEIIEKIINNQMEDYGVGIQKLMEAIRKTYYSNTQNHIMEQCFELMK